MMIIFASLYVRTYVSESANIYVRIYADTGFSKYACSWTGVFLLFIDIASNVHSYEMRIILHIQVNIADVCRNIFIHVLFRFFHHTPLSEQMRNFF